MPRNITITGYTANELRDNFPAAYEYALQNYHNFLWEAGIIADDIENGIFHQVFLDAGLPSLADASLRWDIDGSQGSGVSFDNRVLTYDNIKELGFEMPDGLQGDFAIVRDTGYIGNHYTHEYTFRVEYGDRFYIDNELGEQVDKLAEQLTDALRAVCRKLYRAGLNYDISEQYELEGTENIYDHDGDIIGNIWDGEDLA